MPIDCKEELDRWGFFCLIAFLYALGNNLFTIAMTFHCVALQATRFEMGLLGAGYFAGYALSAWTCRGVRRRLGDRRTLLVAPIAGLLIFSPLGIDLPPWFQVIRIALAGFSGGFFWPSMQAYTSRIRVDGGLLESVGRFNLSWSISGVMLAPLLAGVFYRILPWLPFVFSLAATALCIGLIARFPMQREVCAAAAHPDIAHVRVEIARAFKYMSRVACIMILFCVGVIMFLFPKLADERGLSPDVTGRLLSLHGIALIAAFLWMKTVSRWHFHYGLSLGAVLAAAVSMVVLGYCAGAWIVALALVCFGAARGVLVYATVYYAVAAPGDRFESVGKNEALIACGYLAGPLCGGALAARTGVIGHAFALGALTLGVPILHHVLVRRRLGALQAGEGMQALRNVHTPAPRR